MSKQITLGGTIPLPGYSNIKVEVTQDTYAKTKEYLRLTLLQMCKNRDTGQAIASWWFTVFGTEILKDVTQIPPASTTPTNAGDENGS